MILKALQRKKIEARIKPGSRGWQGAKESIARFTKNKAALISAFVLVVMIIIAFVVSGGDWWQT